MSQTPLFSVIVATCRDDTPFVHHPWHVLDKIIENLRRQTFRDFELIIVDLCYDLRSNYLEQIAPVDFPILHIPDKDSIFKDLSLIRISSSKNTGLLYARGKNVIFSDDGQEWSQDALRLLATWAKYRVGATCRLHRDNGKGVFECDSRWVAYGMKGMFGTKIVNARDIGYLGGTLSMVPIEPMLLCNGWDEMFDGSRQLEDGDMAKRLGETGLKVVLEGHPRCVEYLLRGCNADKVQGRIMVKCNGSYLYPRLDEQPYHMIANNTLPTDEQLGTFMAGRCTKFTKQGICATSKDPCDVFRKKKRRKFICPDIGYLSRIYQDTRLVFNLRQMRAERSWETAMIDPILFGSEGKR